MVGSQILWLEIHLIIKNTIIYPELQADSSHKWCNFVAGLYHFYLQHIRQVIPITILIPVSTTFLPGIWWIWLAFRPEATMGLKDGVAPWFRMRALISLATSSSLRPKGLFISFRAFSMILIAFFVLIISVLVLGLVKGAFFFGRLLLPTIILFIICLSL